jgi:hypothetical protein
MTPFFNPGPIKNPEIPVHTAGVNTRLATLAGELCNGFHVHPFHSPSTSAGPLSPPSPKAPRKRGEIPKRWNWPPASSS